MEWRPYGLDVGLLGDWVALFVLLVRWAEISSAGQSRGGESPERILKQRYTRGEIERDEYLRQLAELRR